MTDPKPQSVRIQTQPDLADALNLWKKDILLSLNCHHIGIVQEVNFEKQTLTASVAYKKARNQRQPDGTYKITLLDYPPAIDVPFVVLSGGGASLRMPITPGDECVLLFNDRDIDNWFQSGQITQVSSSRLHSFSDALALVGVRSLQKSIADYDAETMGMFYNDAFIKIKDNLIGIANSDRNLKDVLTNLITVVKNLSTTNAVVGAPSTLDPATKTLLDDAITQVEELLSDS